MRNVNAWGLCSWVDGRLFYIKFKKPIRSVYKIVPVKIILRKEKANGVKRKD